MTKETENVESTACFMNNFDAYYKKTVSYNYRGHDMRFRVSQSLFSSYDIDIGTQRLLRSITPDGFNASNKILDLGCGYGPLGIALRTAYQPSIVHMVDRDTLALDYSRQNAELNSVSGIKIYGSLGYDDITETDFDLIVSNIPAKVGEPVLSYIIQDAQFFLQPGGRVAIVVIDAIGEYVSKVLTSPNIDIIFQKIWPGHRVFHYKFFPGASIDPSLKQNAFDIGVYDRSQKIISFGTLPIPIQTTYGLPEFDTLSYETELLLGVLHVLSGRHIKRAVVFNPGQGFIPVALSQSTKIGEINLIDRDLQALRVSRRNLVFNSYPARSIRLSHQVGISRTDSGLADCIIGILAEEDSPIVHRMFVRQASAQLAPNGLIILASSSTAITRVEEFVGAEKLLSISERQRSKGKSSIILRHKS